MSSVLVLRAGFAACNNLIRSLKSGDPKLFLVGCNDDRFALKHSPAERKYVVPVFTHPDFPTALRGIIEAERIDLVIPNTDADVAKVSELRDRLPCRTFLPRESVIASCHDKFTLYELLRSHGVPTPLTHAIPSLDEVDAVFGRFAPSTLLWCRLRKGTGSAAAIPVKTSEQARAWISYWQDMRGVSPGSFTLSEYLPGRDITVQLLWKNGTLLMVKMYERLSYHVSGGVPSGVSSTAALAKMIFDPVALEVSAESIRTLDPDASGVFFVDLKENVHGDACVTEINAGRFANVPTIHDLAGHANMASMCVRAALDEPVQAEAPAAYAEDCYVTRGLDALPAVVGGHELFAGIEDWKRLPRN